MESAYLNQYVPFGTASASNIDFSEAWLNDCVLGSSGCDGGSITTTLTYAFQQFIPSEARYPYNIPAGELLPPLAFCVGPRACGVCLPCSIQVGDSPPSAPTPVDPPSYAPAPLAVHAVTAPSPRRFACPTTTTTSAWPTTTKFSPGATTSTTGGIWVSAARGRVYAL
jgi:hypothetical protein